jgi:hypothetical protein
VPCANTQHAPHAFPTPSRPLPLTLSTGTFRLYPHVLSGSHRDTVSNSLKQATTDSGPRQAAGTIELQQLVLWRGYLHSHCPGWVSPPGQSCATMHAQCWFMDRVQGSVAGGWGVTARAVHAEFATSSPRELRHATCRRRVPRTTPQPVSVSQSDHVHMRV